MLSLVASLASARTATLAERGGSAIVALNGGFQLAFGAGALFAAAAVLCGVLMRAELKTGDKLLPVP